MSQAQARALADGAIARTAFELMRPRTIPGVWAADGLVHVWDEDGMRVTASAVDESGKIDLNAVPDPLLNSLLQTAGQVDADTAARLVDVIEDWKDADDFRRPNGAEAAEYQAAGLPYKPANAAFETVADLQRVLGMTPALFARLAGSLTVYSGAPGISPQFASRTVLMALPGATDAIVDTYLAQRAAALAARRCRRAGECLEDPRRSNRGRRRRLRARGGHAARSGPAAAADSTGLAGRRAYTTGGCGRGQRGERNEMMKQH
jgi:general secretion pathway protein K